MGKSEGLVKRLGEIKDNVLRMAQFANGTPAEIEFHRGRVKNGKNFVALRTADGFLFSPSKFSGYADNGVAHMDKLDHRDGGLTNRRITELAGDPLTPSSPRYAEIDREYVAYCSSHRIVPSRHRQARRYWIVD